MKIFKYFASLDIPIMELFGQSENCGPVRCVAFQKKIMR